MASFCVKSLCILVLIAAVFCYPGACQRGFGPAIRKRFGGYHGSHMHYSPPPHRILPQEFGENLAQKYFGDKLIKGFRWGNKDGKRIHSVARKCEDFTNVLKASSCPQPLQTIPLSSGVNNVHCIVEVTNNSEMKETCLQTYESSQYPPEATCILDQPDTLGSKCTA